MAQNREIYDPCASRDLSPKMPLQKSVGKVVRISLRKNRFDKKVAAQCAWTDTTENAKIIDKIDLFFKHKEELSTDRNIIEELYDSDLFHLTELETVSEEYKSVLDKLIKTEEEIMQSFPPCKSLFEEYQTANIALHNLSTHNEFVAGFRTGAQIVLEMLKPVK